MCDKPNVWTYQVCVCKNLTSALVGVYCNGRLPCRIKYIPLSGPRLRTTIKIGISNGPIKNNMVPIIYLNVLNRNIMGELCFEPVPRGWKMIIIRHIIITIYRYSEYTRCWSIHINLFYAVKMPSIIENSPRSNGHLPAIYKWNNMLLNRSSQTL